MINFAKLNRCQTSFFFIMNSNICISTNKKEMKFVSCSTNYKFFMTILDKTIYQFHLQFFYQNI